MAVEDTNKRPEEARDKMFAVLTPEQKAKWSEMSGAKFKLAQHEHPILGTGKAKC